jgi:hypothetical protein
LIPAVTASSFDFGDLEPNGDDLSSNPLEVRKATLGGSAGGESALTRVNAQMVVHRFNSGLAWHGLRSSTTPQRLTIPRSTITSIIACTPCHSAA